MSIITISRGTLSGGQRLAKCLAMNLGYQIMSREVLAEAAQRYGVSEESLARGLEQPPSFWDRFRIDRQIYLTVIRATLCQLVREDNVVYHGNAGHLLLQGVDHVLRVRVIAPLSYRIKAAMEAHSFDEKDAEAYIHKKDEERISWTRFLYGVEWRDPSLYDVLLNLEKVTIEMACNVIVRMVERPEFRMSEESLRQLEDLYVASHVKARLFLNAKIGAAAAKIDVSATSGVVYLAGVLPGEDILQEALATCRSLREVKDVRAEQLGSHMEPV
jgi:cytidylate kinase